MIHLQVKQDEFSVYRNVQIKFQLHFVFKNAVSCSQSGDFSEREFFRKRRSKTSFSFLKNDKN
jgi:hypothetical protein